MKLSSDFGLIHDEGFTAHAACADFIEEMEEREYGSEAINSAWEWFKAGWDARPLDTASQPDVGGRSGGLSSGTPAKETK